jgi:hypothetical protein
MKAGKPKSNTLRKVNWKKPILQTGLVEVNWLRSAKHKQSPWSKIEFKVALSTYRKLPREEIFSLWTHTFYRL